MARVGSWDVDGYATTVADIDADVSGWIDRDFIPFPKAPPKPSSGLGPPPQGGWEDPEPPEVRAAKFLDEELSRRLIERLLQEYADPQQQQLVSLRPPEAEPKEDEWHAQVIPPGYATDGGPRVQVNIGEVHVHHHHYADGTTKVVESGAPPPPALPPPAPAPEQDDSLAMAAFGAAIGGAIGGLPGVAVGALLALLFFGKKKPPPPQLPR